MVFLGLDSEDECEELDTRTIPKSTVVSRINNGCSEDEVIVGDLVCDSDSCQKKSFIIIYPNQYYYMIVLWNDLQQVLIIGSVITLFRIG